MTSRAAFAGSGTTLAVADLHGRDAIGIDFNSENKLIYRARYDEVKKALYGTPAPMPGQGDLFAEVPGWCAICDEPHRSCDDIRSGSEVRP